MNTFQRKSLYAVLAGVGALGASGGAQAVNTSPDGLGQVLIYPYYTVRNDASGNQFNTLVSVTNTTTSAKAVKVRVIEGKNSKEVLDFNLFLSARDVWTMAITPTADGAQMQTTDKSCTLPAIGNTAVPFVNFAYSNESSVGAVTSLDRTREGYIEIIEMGAINDGSTTWTQVTHVNGVPPCGSKLTDTQASADTVGGTGGLMGSAVVINVNSGTSWGENPTVLAAFNPNKNYGNAGTINPDLTTVTPPVSVVTSGSTTYITDWSATLSPVDAVSAVLMHDGIYDEYVLDSTIGARTDWVVTMPTKRYYVALEPVSTTTTPAARLFQSNFGVNGSCDDVSLQIWDREEGTSVVQPSFSPPPPAGKPNQLCWEANVISFARASDTVTATTPSYVLGSTNQKIIPVSSQLPSLSVAGWALLSFPVTGQTAVTPPTNALGNRHVLDGGSTTRVVVSTTPPFVTTNPAVTTLVYRGLPTIGFSAQSYVNGRIVTSTGTNVLSNYGTAFEHKYTRNIQ